MGFLGDLYNKVKRKLYDWEAPIQRNASAGLGQIYSSAKNYLGNTERNIGDYFKPAVDFAQKYPSPLDYTQKVITPKIQDYFQQAPKKIFDWGNNPANTPDWMKTVDTGMRKFSNAAENTPQFTYADKFKNPVVRFVAGIPQQVGNIPSHFAQGFGGYGKNFNIGTSEGRSNYLSKMGRGAEVGLDVGALMGGGGTVKALAKEGFENIAKPTLKSLAWKGVKSGVKQGAGYGAGYGVTSGLQGEGTATEKMMQAVKNIPASSAMGAVAGGVIGGVAPVVGHELGNVIKDIKNRANPEYVNQSVSSKLLDQPAGLSIKDISPEAAARRAAYNERQAASAAKAKELVAKQMENQRQGLETAEPGFVSPKVVKAPQKPVLEQPQAPAVAPKTPLPSVEEYVNGKTAEPKPNPVFSNEDPFKGNPLGEPNGGKPYNYFQTKAFNEKGQRMKSIGEILNYPETLNRSGYYKNEIERMGPQEGKVKARLVELGFPKKRIEKLGGDIATKLADRNVRYGNLPDQNTLNELTLKITGNTENEKIQSAIVNSERVRQEIVSRGQDAYIEGKKLSKSDLKLSEQYEHGVPINQITAKAQNPGQLKNYLNTIKDYYDFRLAADRAVGGDTPRRDFYLRHIWDLSNPEDLARFNELTVQKGMKPWNGFSSQPRTFKTYAEGEALGFLRRNPNTLEDLRTDYGGASHALGRRVLATGLKQAVPEKVSMNGTGMTGDGKPFVNSNIPGLEGMSFHPSVNSQLAGFQPKINKDVFSLIKEKGLVDGLKEGGFANTVGTLYDRVTKPMKHFLLNFSGFHSINVSANYAGGSILNPIKGTKGLVESLPSFFSENLTQKIINGFKTKGVPGTDYSVFDAGLRSGVNMERGLPAYGIRKLNVFAAQSRAIFDRELHTLKLNLVDQVFGTGKVNPESPQGRALGKEINLVMGEINNRTMNINPNTQKWLSRILLAPHFTESKYKVIADALSKSGANGGNLARKAVIGKSLVLGTLSTLGTLLMTGKFPNLNQVLMNYSFAPTTQTNLTNPKGHKIAIGWPKTFISEPAGAVADPGHYIQARFNPLLSDLSQIIPGSPSFNQDYYGNPLIDPNSKKSAAEQIFQNVILGDLPIGVQNLVNYNQGKLSKAQTAINIGGLAAHIDPSDPQSIYFKKLDEARASLKNPNDLTAWDAIHPVNKTTGGEYLIQPTVWDSANKATTYLSHPAVLEAENNLNQALAAQGQTIDPFYTLNPQQQRILNTIATLAPDDPQKSNLEKNNTWITDFQTKRSAFFDALPPGDPNKPKQDIQYPQPSPEVEKLMNDYFDITDSKQKVQFLSDNPGVSDQFAKADEYNRAIRSAKGLPQYDQYPTASPEVQKIMDEYDALPQHDGPKGGSKTRALWIQANPEKNRLRQNFLTQASLYSLEKAAGQAGFQNAGFDSKALGQIKNIGQYDIGVTTDANGNKIYQIAPGAGFGGGYGYGSGSSAASKAISLSSAKLTTLKSKGNYKGWMQEAGSQLNMLQNIANDPNASELQRARAESRIATLEKQRETYNEYGGFSKTANEEAQIRKEERANKRQIAKEERAAERAKANQTTDVKWRYPLVDPEMLKINALIQGTGSKAPVIGKKVLPLIVRRPPAVHRRSVRRKA